MLMTTVRNQLGLVDALYAMFFKCKHTIYALPWNTLNLIKQRVCLTFLWSNIVLTFFVCFVFYVCLKLFYFSSVVGKIKYFEVIPILKETSKVKKYLGRSVEVWTCLQRSRIVPCDAQGSLAQKRSLNRTSARRGPVSAPPSYLSCQS